MLRYGAFEVHVAEVRLHCQNVDRTFEKDLALSFRSVPR